MTSPVYSRQELLDQERKLFSDRKTTKMPYTNEYLERKMKELDLDDLVPTWRKTNKSYLQETESSVAKKALSKSNDSWNRLMEKEQRTQIKYHSTDKTLLILLEEEKAKYHSLETEYQKLLGEVQALQSAHKKELEQQERKFASENKSLQKALLLKSEESTAAHDALRAQADKHSREQGTIKSEYEDFKFKYEKASQQLTELAKKYKLQEKILKSNEGLVSELSKLKGENIAKVETLERQISKLKSDVELHKYREKQLQQDIETLKSSEAQMSQELRKALYSKEQGEADIAKRERIIHDLRMASEQSASREEDLKKDVDNYKSAIMKLKRELQDAQEKNAAANNEITNLNQELKKCTGKINVLQAELQNVKNTINAQLDALQAQEERINYLQTSETNLKKEKENLRLTVKELSEELNRRTSDFEERVEQQKRLLQQIESKKNDLQNANVSLQSKLAKQKGDFDATIQQMEGQIDLLHEKHNSIKNSLEGEIQQLRTQLQQRTAKLNGVTEEGEILKEELQRTKGIAQELELKASELSSTKASLTSQIASMQTLLNSKDQEIELMKVKQNSTNEHIKRLQEEIETHRSISVRKDGDLQKLQNNVNALSRRLKSQVELILDKDLETNNYGSSIRNSVYELRKFEGSAEQPAFTRQPSKYASRPANDYTQILGFEDL